MTFRMTASRTPATLMEDKDSARRLFVELEAVHVNERVSGPRLRRLGREKHELHFINLSRS